MRCSELRRALGSEPFIAKGPSIPLWSGDAPGSEGKTAPERWIETGHALERELRDMDTSDSHDRDATALV